MGRPFRDFNCRAALHFGEQPICDWCGKILMHPLRGRKRDTCSRKCKERRLRQRSKLRTSLFELKSSRKEMTEFENRRLTRILGILYSRAYPNVR